MGYEFEPLCHVVRVRFHFQVIFFPGRLLIPCNDIIACFFRALANSGRGLIDVFQIFCSGFKDPNDHAIVKYVFKSKILFPNQA